MTPEKFVDLLDGFIQINGGELPTDAQWKAITDNLGKVFTKVTPDRRKEPIRNCSTAETPTTIREAVQNVIKRELGHGGSINKATYCTKIGEIPPEYEVAVDSSNFGLGVFLPAPPIPASC